MKDYGPVYDDLLKHCRPTATPLLWSRFSENADLWLPPQDDDATLAALREKHGTADLLRSGVVCQDDYKLVFSPVFLQLYCSILPLRFAAHSTPFDLLTDEGTMSGHLPVYAMMHDHLVQEGIQRTGLLFVTFSLPDLLSLRAVGLPAALASGLEQITPTSIAEFRSIFEPDAPSLAGQASESSPTPATSSPSSCSLAPSPEEGADGAQAVECYDSATPDLPAADLTPAMAAESEHVSVMPSRIIFVGWTPAKLSSQRSANLDRVLRNVVKMGSCIDIDLDAIFVWRPAVAEIQRMGVCLTKGTQKDAIKAILESLDQSAHAVSPTHEESGSPGGFLEARQRFRDALLRPGGSPAYRRRRIRAFQDAVDRAFVEPICELAAKEPDADQRSRLGGLAALSRMLHPSVEMYCARLEREIARVGLRGDGRALEAKEVMKMFDVLCKLTKRSK